MDNLRYHNLFNLKDKNAIVTGGTGLLGKKFCKGLAEFGANVAVIDLVEYEVNKFAEELEELYGIKAVGIGCNVSVQEEVNSMVSKVVQEFGEINILQIIFQGL